MPNASLRILQPEGTTNYITNPQLRYATTGWNAVGSTIGRTLSRARFGVACLVATTNGAAMNEGTFFRVSALSGVSGYVTVSAYVRGAGKVRIRVIDNPRGKQWFSKPVAINDDRWTRIEATGRITGSNDVRLYVETADSRAIAVQFYVDGAQMELKSYSTTYCDGDQEDCRWNLSAHSTLSTRDNKSRTGGRWVALAGPCRENDDIYLTVVGGLGMPSVSNNTQPFALAPGGYLQSTKVNMRVITLAFNVKKESRAITKSVSLAKLHELRQQLIDVIKPDNGLNNSDLIFEYKDGSFPIYFSARYEAGLDGGWDIRNQWTDSFPIRLVSVSPMLWEDNMESKILDFSDSLGVNRTISGRENGVWNAMNGGTDGAVYDMAIGKFGELYVVGNFSVINRNGTISPNGSARSIAVWDGSKFSPIGNGTLTGGSLDINAVAVGADGTVYVTGSFTGIGGLAANRVASWNGIAWRTYGTGLNGTGNAIAVAPNGDIYVGGTFAAAGGVTVNNVARWDGYQWRSMGSYVGVNGNVSAIAIERDGSGVYIGGTFTDETGTPHAATPVYGYILAYNPSTNLFSAMGGGLQSGVDRIIISSSGVVYAGGATNIPGNAAALAFIVEWNGSIWSYLGGGLNNILSGLDIDIFGNIIAGGSFTVAGSVDVLGLALWNSSTWVNIDTKSPVGLDVRAVKIHDNGNIYLGGVAGGEGTAAGITVVTNIGSAEVSPKMYILGPGRLRWIENQTTKKRMYIDLNILSSEEVVVDFGKAEIGTSKRGDVSYAVLPGSDFKSFTLIPGENIVACFMTNDVNGLIYMSYTPTHWSVDATARGDELV